MKAKSTLLTCALLLAMQGNLQAQKTKVIAHRGFWQTNGSAQNSIAALTKADSVNCYASEFDVWLSADRNIVVNHDATFKGVILQEATTKVCTAIELNNGEQLPTLQQYLEQAQKLQTRLILELKSHKTPEQETIAIEQIVQMMKYMRLEKRIEYISFSEHAIREFVRLAPKGTPIYFLRGDFTPAQLKEIGCTGADYHISVFKKNPEWIKECHKLGLKVNVWTVNEYEDMLWAINNGVDFITTDQPVVLQQVLKEKAL